MPVFYMTLERRYFSSFCHSTGTKHLVLSPLISDDTELLGNLGASKKSCSLACTAQDENVLEVLFAKAINGENVRGRVLQTVPQYLLYGVTKCAD